MVDAPPLPPPPRTVPATTHWRVLLGGVLPTIGWCLLAFGGFMATLFVGNSELVTAWRFSGELAVVEGSVVRTERTSMEVNGANAYEVTFGYRVYGQDRLGVAYSIGNAPEPESRVAIEYVVDDPDTARIRGMPTKPFPVWVAFVLIFPMVGLAFIVFGLVRGRRLVRLMAEGESAWGLLTDRSPTRTRINQQTVYALQFTFVARDGQQRRARAKSHRSEYFRDDIARHVLHDGDSGRSCIVELLPGGPKVDDGHWRAIGFAGLLPVLILPTVAVLVIWTAQQISF